MTPSQEILSSITVFSKYARYDKKKKRRETWDEIIERNMQMHIKRYPQLKEEIEDVYIRSVFTKKVLPSMRSLQFAGEPIERNPSRIYNCAFLPIEDSDAFAEIMFLLLGGTGVGYSVQRRHVDKLPIVSEPRYPKRRYLIGDNIEGWADAVKVLVESFFYGKDGVEFDYSAIRDKGTELVVSGGKAPGPEPLRACLEKTFEILQAAIGRKLSPLEAHDIACFEADAVLAGGIRRAAMISLFSPDDEDMINCKSGEWWNVRPERARANNSVVLVRGVTTKEDFESLWDRVRNSGAGEPGFYWTNNPDWGTNPCCEIALKPYQFCNLTEINASDINDQDDFNQRAKDASFLGTLQAGYTNFHYLRPIWKATTEGDALIGVGLTGIASNRIALLDEVNAATQASIWNEYTALRIGINPASRVTTVKPSGTTSLVVGSSSGIHGWHNDFYLRRMRFGVDESIYRYLSKELPQLVEKDQFNPKGGIICIPQRAPDGATFRTETALDLLTRVSRYNRGWVHSGFRTGDNQNNVSVTVSIREDEWDVVRDWMWDNRSDYNGISVLPYDGGSYIQAPFEDISQGRYEYLEPYLKGIDLTKVIEMQDETNLINEVACSGGQCDVDDLFTEN